MARHSFNYTSYRTVDDMYQWSYEIGSSNIFLAIMLLTFSVVGALALVLTIISAIEGWFLLCLPLITMSFLLWGLTFVLYLAFQYDQKFVGIDTLVSDFGSPEYLEYTSLKFRCLYAMGLQTISSLSTQCFDYFETTSLVKSHSSLITHVTKSKLNAQDILSFILSLPPMALTDDRIFAAIMLLLKHRHDIQATQVMHTLSTSLENYTPKTPKEQFSLAIIHRSGLFGTKLDRSKAKQFFQAICYDDPNYYAAKIELGSMALSEAVSSAPSASSQRKLLDARDHFSIAERFASTKEEKEMAKDLGEQSFIYTP